VTLAVPLGRWSCSALVIAAGALLVVHSGGRFVGLAALLAFAFLAPVWSVLLVAFLLAADWGSLADVSPMASTALAVLVVACAAARIPDAISGASLVAASAFLGLGFAVAVAGGNHAVGKDVWRAALPYLPVLLVAFRVDRETRDRLLDGLAAVAGVYAMLFLLAETTHAQLLPGIATLQPAVLAGRPITRVETYGQLIPVLGFLWSLASLLTRTGNRTRSGAVALLSLAAIVAGLGRTALVALLLAGAATALLAAGRRPTARPVAIKIVGLCIVTASVAFLYASSRFGAALGELSSGSGNFGVRLEQWHSRLPLVSGHLLLGLGFDGRPGLGTSDSSVVSALVRFGLVGLAVTLLVATVAFVRTVRGSADSVVGEARVALFACGALVYLVLAAATTSSLYYPLGIASFGLVLGLAWARA
jgi:hypothetical protein